MIDEQELLAGFIEESQGHLQVIEPDLLLLEQEGDNIDTEVVNRIFRSIHSIKGASGFFGLIKIGELSHVMENLFSLLRDRKINMTQELTDALLEGVDNLRAMIDDVGESENFDIHENLKKLKILLQKAESPGSQVAETEGEETVQEEIVEEPTGEVQEGFKVSDATVDEILSSGKYLYSVNLYLEKDMRVEGRDPFDYFNSLGHLGDIIDSFVDKRPVKGLDDCLTKDLQINFLFTSVLEPELAFGALELPEERITHIDLEKHREQTMQKLLAPLTSRSAAETVEEAETAQAEAAAMETDKPAADQADPVSQQGKAAKKIQTEEKLRVGVNLLNDLVNLAGELVLGRNQLVQITAPLEKDISGMKNVMAHVSRITTEIQGKIMHLRMQPVSIIFSKFHRIVRDLARNLKKEVALETYGEDVELDKSIIEALSDPLTHLIRNSVDHGIESPEEREKSGKPQQGTIQLKAFHQGGQVHLEISDDGKGIDAEIVGDKAVEKGLISQEERDSMQPKDLMKMIFKPGFSTAQKISSVSGRGVGMDVVVTNIEQLGGTVEIDSILGQGTTMSLILPLTLAIVSGLVIKVRDHKFIVPEVSIDEMVRIKPENIPQRINLVQDAHVLRLREKLLPLINLRPILWEEDESDAEIYDRAKKDGIPLRILVLKFGNSRFGLVVDHVDNFEEIVVKPLPRFFKKMKYVSGTTIMGDGNVSLILDVAGIVESAALKDLDHLEGEIDQIKESLREEDKQSLLIFDNSTQERFALPLELISRLERITSDDVEVIENVKYMQYQGQNLRLIFLEDYLPVNRPFRESDDNLKVIIPKQMKYPVGIVFNNIIDTVRTEVKLDTKTMMAPGLFGSAVIKDKITLLIDLYRILEMAAPEWFYVQGQEERGSNRRILLVEDTAFFRMVEAEYLQSAGYEVILAENGDKALKLLETEDVDLVILDIIMPGKDGYEVIKEIRANEKHADLPVLAVTSLWDEASKQKGMAAGFTDWEAKLNKDTLLAKIEAMLEFQEETQ